MSNISFKAQITGINDFYKEWNFKEKTCKDTKHKVIYNGKDPVTKWEYFSLLKNGKTTVKDYPIFYIKSNNGEFSLENLLKIFNILKVKEAQKLIAEHRKIKAEKEFTKFIEELDKEDKAKIQL